MGVVFRSYGRSSAPPCSWHWCTWYRAAVVVVCAPIDGWPCGWARQTAPTAAFSHAPAEGESAAVGRKFRKPVACSLLTCSKCERNMTSRSSTADEIADTARIPVCDFAVGEVIAGKYRVEAPLAEGGMGVVLRAT